MSKPLGYYVSYTPGDESFLEDLQERYGSTLEKIGNREKLYLIGVLASQLSVKTPGEIRTEIYELATEINDSLQTSDRAGLIEAMIAQVRWGQNAEPVHHT
ncbi:hypothetical protein I8751_13245 [Nostocaceae cyanobacterium CENA357]|uniref:Uncharacterized protein n=1 Tax=Atlanticothrix silvestris CENA357 TaxID=1725252 RepID=A0A8J7L469_9CYAN|nr:hypothetical protein [Atlanticothrix silvestris]MBH8553322.1 hypothetical protein [Atlanticothrix silvestris CENA357]